MKKKSISLFAILVVTFIISIAFTTTHKKAPPLSNEWYVLLPEHSIQPVNIPESINDINIYWPSDASGPGYAERYTDYQAAALCESQEEFVCAIQMEGADANNDDELDVAELTAFLAVSKHTGVLYRAESD